MKEHGAPEACRLYLEHFASRPDVTAGIQRDLACWCSLPDDGEPDMCHAALLLAIANQDPKAGW